MKNVIVEKSFEFAVEIVKMATSLKNNKLYYEIASQLLKSGTSIGANIAEAQYSQSNKDFASKMHIALKEANETQYWLRLLKATEAVEENKAKLLLNDVEEIKRILTAILKTIHQKQQS